MKPNLFSIPNIISAIGFVVLIIIAVMAKKLGKEARIGISIAASVMMIQLISSVFQDTEGKKERNEIKSLILENQEIAISLQRAVDKSVAFIDSGKNGEIYADVQLQQDTPDDSITQWVVDNRNDVIFKDDIFYVDMRVRKEGTIDWTRGIDAEVGDVVEFQFMYKNTTKETSHDVMIRSILPTNMEYIDDSTILYNSNYQSGVSVKNNTVTTNGINIGNYNPYGNAYIRFKAIIKNYNLVVGTNQLVTWISATSNGEALYDDVNIYVEVE